MLLLQPAYVAFEYAATLNKDYVPPGLLHFFTFQQQETNARIEEDPAAAV